MSALASLERFGEEDPFFKKWRSCWHCLQSEWALAIFRAYLITILERWQAATTPLGLFKYAALQISRKYKCFKVCNTYPFWCITHQKKSLKGIILGDFHQAEKNEKKNLGLSSTLMSETFIFSTNKINFWWNLKLPIKKQDFYNFYHWFDIPLWKYRISRQVRPNCHKVWPSTVDVQK